MSKKTPVVAIIAFALGAALGAGIVLKSCGPDKAYWVERAKYDADVADATQKLGDALVIIAEKDLVIAKKDKDLVVRETRIDDLEAAAGRNAVKITALANETARLKADAQAVIDANPAVRALVDNFELRCVTYEKQIFTLTETVKEERGAKEDWIVKFDAKDIQYQEAWAYGQREHGLRLTSDSLRLGLEKKLYRGKFWKVVALMEPPVFGILSLIFK